MVPVSAYDQLLGLDKFGHTQYHYAFGFLYALGLFGNPKKLIGIKILFFGKNDNFCHLDSFYEMANCG